MVKCHQEIAQRAQEGSLMIGAKVKSTHAITGWLSGTHCTYRVQCSQKYL